MKGENIMNERSVGSNMNLLFVGYAISLVVSKKAEDHSQKRDHT